MNSATTSLILRNVILAMGLTSVGLMADIFDEWEPVENWTDPPRLFNIRKEKAFLGIMVIADVVTILLLVLAFLKVKMAQVDSALNGLMTIIVAVGWGMYAGWVADIENFYYKSGLGTGPEGPTASDIRGHMRWITKAGSVLTLMGISIPLYLTVAILSIKNTSKQ